MEISRQSIIKSKENILETYIGDELLLFDPLVGRLFEINEIGGVIWKLLDGKHLIGEIILHLKKEYGDVKEVDKDLLVFLSRLFELNLVEMSK